MSLYFEEAGSGAETVVLLHATACDSRMWDPLWEPLAESFRVLRMDFRGFGRTPYAASGPYSEAADVAELLASRDLRRVHLVGASGGGQVALQLATAHPELVSRLVLLCAGCGLPPTPELAAFSAEEDRLLAAGDLEGAVALNVDTWCGPASGAEMRRWLAGMQRHAFRVQLAADPEPEWVEEPVDLAAVAAPALVVTGAHDLPYFRESGRHLAAVLPAARAVELDWGGHLPSMERPQEVLSLITGFLRDPSAEQPGARPPLRSTK